MGVTFTSKLENETPNGKPILDLINAEVRLLVQPALNWRRLQAARSLNTKRGGHLVVVRAGGPARGEVVPVSNVPSSTDFMKVKSNRMTFWSLVTTRPKYCRMSSIKQFATRVHWSVAGLAVRRSTSQPAIRRFLSTRQRSRQPERWKHAVLEAGHGADPAAGEGQDV